MRAVRLGLHQLIQAVACSLQFLTRLPVPIRTIGSNDEFRRSTIYFPAVGLLIGAIVAVAGYGFSYIFPVLVNAILLLILWTSLSGGLHLDGLMDSADGLLSHRSPERMLEIMKDSHVGAMGVIVCVLYLLLKMSLILYILTFGGIEGLVLLTVIPIWSRAFMVTAIAKWPYARSGQGMGKLFQTVKDKHAVGATIMALLLSVVVIIVGYSWIGDWSHTWGAMWIGDDQNNLILLGTIVVTMFIVTYGLGGIIAAAITRKLGGLTGDVYGALNEITEVSLLLVLVGVLFSI